MRTVFSAMFLILYCALQLTSAAPFAYEKAQSICCPKASKIIIPLTRLESYFFTSNSCPIKYIVIETKGKKQFCVNPDEDWVKRAINHINKHSTTKSTK